MFTVSIKEVLHKCLERWLGLFRLSMATTIQECHKCIVGSGQTSTKIQQGLMQDKNKITETGCSVTKQVSQSELYMQSNESTPRKLQ